MICKHIDRIFKRARALFCTYLNGFKYCNQNSTADICLHTVCSIWPIKKILLGSTTPGQSEPGSNDNKVGLHIP